jgi:hypothetical protein
MPYTMSSDTIVFFMIPAKDSNKHIPELTDGGTQTIGNTYLKTYVGDKREQVQMKCYC